MLLRLPYIYKLHSLIPRSPSQFLSLGIQKEKRHHTFCTRSGNKTAVFGALEFPCEQCYGVWGIGISMPTAVDQLC